MTTTPKGNIPQKEPYARPTLTLYGTIHELTHANISMGMNDMVGGFGKTG